MSTKLLNGFKFKSNDIFEVYKNLSSLRTKCAEISKEKSLEYQAVRSTTLLDRFCFYREKFEKPPTPLVDCYLELIERIKKVKEKGHRDPEIDFDFEVVVLPHSGSLYGLYFTEQKEFKNLLTSADFLEDFSYWDHTDKDEKVSEKDWQHRANVWDGIFQDTWTPAEVGFSIHLSDVSAICNTANIKDVLSKVPSVTVRLKDLVTDLLFEERVKTSAIELNSSNVIKEYGEYKTWLDSEEGQRVFEDRQELHAKHLIICVEEGHLLGDSLK